MNNKKKSSKNLVIFTIIFVGLVVALVLLNQNSQPSNRSEGVFDNPPATENQPTLGDKNAKVSIVEFGDYKCPSCKAWGENIMPQLSKDFIETGKASFSYINVLFHGEESKTGALAAEAIRLQDPEAFWTFHHEVFNAQPETEQHDNAWLTPDKALELAKEYTPNIDLAKLKEDMGSKQIEDQVGLDEELVREYNVQQTPTIMINNVMVSNPFDYEEISSLINAQLKE
ncbi:DsbA family protein [Paenibacillus sp. p3-SID867]|uniref:DsbA family protein n=1 Tax=Paenibacillus sp. p3-SID867 TaxID=2916363 RepID=UPI0021A82C9A|nr:DsbA family protein [Paenibacillus sp. p3-SID867]MCT1403044.1 DsbA family protein [Paenibacillus sp. p3-SID867]